MPKALKDFVAAALETVPEVSPEEAARLQTEGWRLLDVREGDEFAVGHPAGAENFPRGFLEVKADLEHAKRDPSLADRAQPLLLICGGGHRSALAGKALQEMGFDRVASVRGGWRAWEESGLPRE